MDGSRLRCFLTAWVVAWAVGVFLPSALVAVTGLAGGAEPPSRDIGALLGATWRVADAVSPLAKLSFGALFALLLLAAGRMSPARPAPPLLLCCLAGIVATVLVLQFLPAQLSTGFGVGLVGVRFHGALLACYLAGAVAAGATFHLAIQACLRKQVSSPTDVRDQP